MKSKTVRADTENGEQEAVKFEERQPQCESAPSRQEIRQRAHDYTLNAVIYTERTRTIGSRQSEI